MHAEPVGNDDRTTFAEIDAAYPHGEPVPAEVIAPAVSYLVGSEAPDSHGSEEERAG